MSIFKLHFYILILILFTQLSFSQEFVDDLYFNDAEVNYEFLYSKNTIEA